MKSKKNPSMQMIADILGISKNSVSIALNDKPGVSDELKQKVWETAHQLKYKKGKQLTEQAQILLIIPEYIIDDSYFYNKIYWSIERANKQNNDTSIVACIHEKMEDALILPNEINNNIKGIFAIGIFKKEYIRLLSELDIPLVLVDNYYEDLDVSSVTTANIDGAYIATRHLIENGHKDIGFVGSIRITTSHYERYMGFEKAMSVAGLTINSEHCILSKTTVSSMLQDPDEVSDYLSRFSSMPTAFFCASDRIAIAVINSLNKLDCSVPDDISIVSFDNIEAASFFTPNLTTMNVKRELMGTAAVELLHKIKDRQATVRWNIKPDLVIRDSVKKIL